jgi:hypothetical protein
MAHFTPVLRPPSHAGHTTNFIGEVTPGIDSAPDFKTAPAQKHLANHRKGRSTVKQFIVLVLFTLITACSGQAAQGADTIPIISAFTATPDAIAAGEISTLAWTVTGAERLSLEPAFGEVSGPGLIVAPPQTTTYTLTATNAAGSVSAEVTVTVLSSGEEENPDGANCGLPGKMSGSLTLGFESSGQDDNGAVSVNRAADVSFLLERTPGGQWEGTSMTGRASVHDSFTTSALSEEIRGEGEPVSPTYSLLRLKTDCTISAQVFVEVVAQNSTIFGEAAATVAVIYLDGVALAGAAELATHTWYFGQSGSGVALTQGQDYVEGFAQNLGMMLGHDALGNARVTWSFTPAP